MKEQKDEDLARARDEKIASEAYDEVAEMEQENGELLQDLQRTRAEFENYRKRSEQNLALAKSAGKAEIAKKILPLLDIFDSILATKTDDENLARGLEISGKKLAKTLTELGLEKTAAKAGDEFDHATMFAVAADGDGAREIVAEILQPGYSLDGNLLRPAMVKISRE